MITKRFSWPYLLFQLLPSLFPSFLGRLSSHLEEVASLTTQLNHCSQPSAFRGHCLSYCQIPWPIFSSYLMTLSEGQDLVDDSLLHKTLSSPGLHSTAFSSFPPIFLTFQFHFFSMDFLCFVYSSNDDISLSVLFGPLLFLYTSVL